MRRSFRLVTLAIVAATFPILGLTASASEPKGVSPPTTVRSPDGGLTVSIPRGALPAGKRVRITVLPPSRYPVELRGATFRSGTRLYELQPAGLRLLKPVRITRTFDASVSGFSPGDGLPGVVLTTRSGTGAWNALSAHVVRRQGSRLIVQADARHFSTLVSFDDQIRLVVTPDTQSVPVGGTLSVRFAVTAASGLTDAVLAETEWTPPAFTEFAAEKRDDLVSTETMTCRVPGKQRITAEVVVIDRALSISLLQGSFGGVVRWKFHPSFEVECRAVATPPTLTAACVITVHKPLSVFPSYLRWLFAFAPGTLPPSARVEVTATGVNGGQPFSAAIDAVSGRAEAVGGISSFGAKQVQRIGVAGIEVTQQVVGKLGTSAPTVTAAQTVIAGTCP